MVNLVQWINGRRNRSYQVEGEEQVPVEVERKRQDALCHNLKALHGGMSAVERYLTLNQTDGRLCQTVRSDPRFGGYDLLYLPEAYCLLFQPILLLKSSLLAFAYVREL